LACGLNQAWSVEWDLTETLPPPHHDVLSRPTTTNAADIQLMYVNLTQVFVNPTQVCVNPTQVCVNPTQVFVNPTQVFVNPTQVCVNPTQVCVNPTQVCVNPTQMCVNPTQVCVYPAPRCGLAGRTPSDWARPMEGSWFAELKDELVSISSK
jgi:hypothetical protein